VKRLIVCCDGTWQKLSSNYPSNVVKITQAIKPLAEDKTPQVVFYDEGIGTGKRIDKLLGGAIGRGIDQNIQDVYRLLCLNYEEGDEIYLYGFSRGAYTVRSLAGLIYCSGLLYRNKIGQAPQAYKLYRKRTKPGEISTPNTEEAINFRRNNSRHVPITFLGCWDTVGALGIPDQISWLSIDEQFNQKYQFHDTSLSPIIHNARHAVAIDEIKRVFDVTPMLKSSKNPAQNLHQVWFPGEHGCVGGGTKKQSGLSDGALQWMIDESKTVGLEFDESKVIEGVNPDPTIAFNNTSKLILILAGHNLRKVDFASLHPSVIARWSKVDNYRPKNLADYEAQLNNEREVYLARQNKSLSNAA
jgi:uncharacterized protein (DUF2235 family)